MLACTFVSEHYFIIPLRHPKSIGQMWIKTGLNSSRKIKSATSPIPLQKTFSRPIWTPSFGPIPASWSFLAAVAPTPKPGGLQAEASRKLSICRRNRNPS